MAQSSGGTASRPRWADPAHHSQLRFGGGPVPAGTTGGGDREGADGRQGNPQLGRYPHGGTTPLTPIMGRATDPGENRDPGSERHGYYNQTSTTRPSGLNEKVPAFAKLLAVATAGTFSFNPKPRHKGA